MSEATATTILVVDDDDVFRTQLARALRSRGFEVSAAATADAALASAEVEAPELAIVDLNLGGVSGLTVVRDLVAKDAGTQVLVLTGYGSIATAVEAIRLGAVGYLPKPADVDELLAAFAKAKLPPLVALPSELPAPSLARAEWEHLQRVLTDCGGNISQAARKLGLHRRSLQRKLAKAPVRE